MSDDGISKVCVKILLHTNIPARKAALGRNYFSRRNNFGLYGSWLLSLYLIIIIIIIINLIYNALYIWAISKCYRHR